jgi:hypothetical protein
VLTIVGATALALIPTCVAVTVAKTPDPTVSVSSRVALLPRAARRWAARNVRSRPTEALMGAPS